MIGTKIKLNESEQAICVDIAKKRFDNNRKSNVKNSKIGEQSDYVTDLEGFAAEMAFSKIFNVYPDFSVETRNANEDQGDCVVNNKIVDVKTTKYKTGKLLAVKWKASNTDLYALMIGEFPSYTFKGFMTSKELLKEKRIGSLGHGNTYIAEQSELVELDEIENEYNFLLNGNRKYKWDLNNNLINTITNEIIPIIEKENIKGYLIDSKFQKLDEIRDNIINIKK